ncbi:hypothetical protein [Nocardia stercoris]|uniref:Uncharacterized protein n=1 Tax=Nocardia stercoris TaxID=2483361 RepID=A0A3M2KXT8_9NOCA|nr:hypothetical protein [Nocardia stercoris]RMI29894.1 hypothetical protein EBN03_24180 [Nocardia stercoris]
MMGKISLDYGQSQISAFNEAARSGQIRYDRDVALRAAHLYEETVTTLLQVRTGLEKLIQRGGFGDFSTGKELATGFSNKAQDGIDAITSLIEGALSLKEAYLRSGSLIEEADAAHAAALQQAQIALRQNDGSRL